MDMSLEQAVEIHAKMLRHIHGDKAPHDARHKAKQLAARGDAEGHKVWLMVAEAAEKLPVETWNIGSRWTC